MGGVDGSALDVLLLAAVVLFAVSGYRQGLVVGLLSFVGFFGGGLLGAQLATPVAQALTDSVTVAPLVGIVVVFVSASLGQLFAVTLGGSLRQRLTWRPVRLVDSAGGAVISAVSVLLVAWMVATPVASSPYPALAAQVRRSIVINAVDNAVPDVVRNLYDSFRRLVDRGGFPEIFGSLAPTRVRPVAPPDPKVLNSTAVLRARGSIVKITGVAGDCSRRLEGSGFVYAPQRVMTNAHVVAGVRSPRVEVDGRRLDATVVLYDPRVDVAVLRVPELTRRPLSFAGAARGGESAAVAGYPEDGPFNVVAARIRGVQVVRGPDIYQSATVSREVYALRAKVRSGNSGGPLLAADGRVYGVVFAAAADDTDTGFALTANEVRSDAARGRTATDRVGTQGCD